MILGFSGSPNNGDSRPPAERPKHKTPEQMGSEELGACMHATLRNLLQSDEALRDLSRVIANRSVPSENAELDRSRAQQSLTEMRANDMAELKEINDQFTKRGISPAQFFKESTGGYTVAVFERYRREIEDAPQNKS